MRYTLTPDFTQLSETSGILQNQSAAATIEVSGTGEAHSGILIHPGGCAPVSGTVYARKAGGSAPCVAAVLPTTGGAGGGGVDTNNLATEDDIKNLFRI